MRSDSVYVQTEKAVNLAKEAIGGVAQEPLRRLQSALR
jgi:hypothetical protein